MCSWSWKHIVVMFLSLMLVMSLFINFKVQMDSVEQRKSNEVKLECLEPGGDAVLTCYFSKTIVSSNVTAVESLSGSLSGSDIMLWSNVHIHPYNMPEHMLMNLGQFFKSIEHLAIHNSKLKFLHRNGFTSIAERLNHLDLHHNEISAIASDTFEDLVHLVYLQLSGNKLTSLTVPSFIAPLHLLHTFAANANQISEVHENFFASQPHFEGLRWIYLAGNKIQRLAVDFGRFERLRAVDLRGNRGSCNFLFNSHENATLPWQESLLVGKTDLYCG